MEWALEAGYRHIDTAYLYMNEAAIGEVLDDWIRSGKVKREELFITTKVFYNCRFYLSISINFTSSNSCRLLGISRKRWSIL